MVHKPTSMQIKADVFDVRWNSININTPMSLTLQQYMNREHDGVDIEYFGSLDVLYEDQMLVVELDIGVDILASHKKELEQELRQSFPDMDVDEMIEYLTWQEVSSDMSVMVTFTSPDFERWIKRAPTEDESAEVYDEVKQHCYHEAYQLFRGMFRERANGTVFSDLVLPSLEPSALCELLEEDEGGILRLDQQSHMVS